MNVLRRWIAIVAGLHGLAGISWGLWLVYLAFFRDTPPTGRTGDVVGLPDPVMHRLVSGFYLWIGFPALFWGTLDLGAAVAYLKRGARLAMLFACVLNGLVWCVVALRSAVLVSHYGEDPTSGYAISAAAVVVAALHFACTRLFKRSRNLTRVGGGDADPKVPAPVLRGQA